jgi:hypothetical protein
VKTLAENRIRGNMLYFVQNIMENRSFRVLGEETSGKMYIENGGVQGAVLTYECHPVIGSDGRNNEPDSTTSQNNGVCERLGYFYL